MLYEVKKLRKYPHMLPADVKLWERWIDRYPDFFSAVEYDIHVGGTVKRLPWWSDAYKEMASALAARKIDVVGHRPGEVWIVELKPDAGASAIGQLLCYRILYNRKFQPTSSVVLCLITNNMVPDEEYLCGMFGIKWFEV